MILIRSSKYPSSLLFCKRDICLVVCWCCFLNRRLFSPEKPHFTIAKNLHILKRVYPWFWSEVPHIFRAYFSVKETLVLSFINVVLSKGSFLVHKNDILLKSKNLHILKRVNQWFWSEVPNIFEPTFVYKRP